MIRLFAILVAFGSLAAEPQSSVVVHLINVTTVGVLTTLAFVRELRK
jgi:hypothetical protein